MRKVVATLFYALDGVVEAPNTWQFAYDDQMGDAVTAEQEKQDAVLLGRRTYDMWASYWPTADDDIDFKHFINKTQKYVASTTLETLEWENSTLVTGDFAEAVRNLKTEPGRDIGIHGSPSIVRQLLHAGLVDEIKLLLHPVFAGSGKKRLIEPGDKRTRLDLVDAIRGDSGTMILVYRPHQD